MFSLQKLLGKVEEFFSLPETSAEEARKDVRIALKNS